MEEEIDLKNDIYSGNDGSISATTNKIYANILKKYDLSKDFNELIVAIKNNSNLSASSKCMHFSALYWHTKNEDFKTEINALRKVTLQEYKDGKKPNKIDWDLLSTKASELKKKWEVYKTVPVNKWSKKIYLLAQGVLMSYLYFDLPARRSEYILVQFTDKTDNNYYDSHCKTFYFRKYKTARYHGVQNVTVNSTIDELIQNLRAYSNSDYMFTSSKGKPFNLKDLNATLKKHFGASTCMIRRSYISDCYKALPPMHEMEKRAFDMGHSLNTALLCYRKEMPV
jgi:hypothetical protein